MYLCNVAMHWVRGVSTLFYKQAEIGVGGLGFQTMGQEWQWQAWEPVAVGAGMVQE
jgi:hypothetical protein